MYRLFLLSHTGRIVLFVGAAVVFAGCSNGDPTPTKANATSNGLSTTVAGLAAGSGRLAGHVGPGRPGDDSPRPALTLTFNDGKSTVHTTVHDGTYTVDLPAGTWDVRSDDASLCATGLAVRAAAWQSNDLGWPFGGCQDLSGPPENPSPPTGPTPPSR
jgi:outer membrane murein-binding lipoprotein Lpp